MRKLLLKAVLITLILFSVPAVSRAGEHIEISGIRVSGDTVKVTVTCPSAFTNRLDVYVCTNIVQGDWYPVASNLALDSSNCLNWAGSVGGTGQKFYMIIGNADLDSNGNGLTDAREKLVFKIDPALMDSDGDGLPDGWEYRYSGNPTNMTVNGDEDIDGWNNLTEYSRGGNPKAVFVEDTGDVLGFEVLTPMMR